MKLTQLFNDDDAVSPVIGVILMVAITVILAAVIASFVLGLGSSADEVQPNTSFDVDWNHDDAEEDTITITVSSGDSIDPDVIWIRGDLSVNAEGIDATLTEIESDAAGDEITGVNDGETEFVGDVDGDISSGQGIEIQLAGSSDDDNIRVHDFNIVWDTGDDSATIGSNSGPDA